MEFLKKHWWKSSYKLPASFIIFFVLVLIGAILLLKSSSSSKTAPRKISTPSSSQNEQPKINPIFGTPCKNNPSIKFSHDITEIASISHIVPPGWATIEIKPHSFIFIDPKVAKVPIYVPVDSDLVEGVYKNAKNNTDYDLHFQASCEVWFLVNHISNPVEAIRGALPSVPQTTTQDPPRLKNPIHFKAGDLIGYTTGVVQSHSFDFGVEDAGHTNQFVNMERYEKAGLGSRPLHAVCPYDLFSTSKKSAYYSKFGDEKIDPGTFCRGASQDKAGTIAGAWFPTSDGRDSDDPKIAIGLQTDGKLRLTGTAFSQFFIAPDNPTYAKPENVTEQHCFQEGGRIIFLKLVFERKMQVFINDYGGRCPGSFPGSGYTTYYR